jgi:hypothetical protein
MSLLRAARILISLASSAIPLLARGTDGLLEINQACATSTGCFQGDAPGFPVTITAEGSYRLTSDLVVPANTDGIQVANNVSIDLNQFAVRGPVVCGPCSATGTGSGVVSAAQGGRNCTLRNGKVHGFALDGIWLGEHARIEGLTLGDIARHALDLGGGSLVTGNLIDGVGVDGVHFAASTPFLQSLYRDNTISNIGQIRPLGGQSVVGGRASGANACTDSRCGRSGKKFFYLSQQEPDGLGALDACETGFHMASFWEIADPTALEYDTSRGRTRPDSGEGPPNGIPGWTRTGGFNLSTNPASGGSSNCDGWSTNTSTGRGTWVQLKIFWEDTSSGANPISPWESGTYPCVSAVPVWCVQD